MGWIRIMLPARHPLKSNLAVGVPRFFCAIPLFLEEVAMSGQAVDSGPTRGNRTSYDGAEMLMALWVLAQFTDQAHPLLAKEVREKAAERFGNEAVPAEKKIRKCLETLVGWTAPNEGIDTDGAHAHMPAPTLCMLIPRVEKVGQRGGFGYYVYRDPEMQRLCDDLGVSLDAACQAQIEQRAVIKELPRRCTDEVAAGDAVFDPVAARDKAAYSHGPFQDEDRRSAVEILAMAVTLRRAIEDRQAVSFIRSGYRPLKYSKAADGTYPVSGFQNFELEEGLDKSARVDTINDTQRDYPCRWPYAVTYMEGQYYLLVNATGNRDKLAPVPLAEIYELTIVDPESPRDHNGFELPALGRRPAYDELVAGYYDGAVLGRGASKAKVDIKLLCKGDGFNDAYLAFRDFEGFAVYKGNPALHHDGIEKVERPYASQSINSNAWYTVCFKAHPHGVEEWVKRRLRDAKILEPEKSARQIAKYVSGIRFDRWGQLLESPACKKAVVPDEIAALDYLDDEEKKLLAAYRAYKARKGASC